MSNWQLILTCEHGGNEVPEKYNKLFTGNSHVLLTHRGYDIGALDLAQWLSKRLESPLIFSATTRLLVDLNRSVGSHSLFSSFIASLTSEEKQEILRCFYFPYREKVIGLIKQYLQQGKRVLHLSIHSFTPILNGKKRNADIGLLYDSARPLEKKTCRNMAEKICELSSLVVRYNYPYRGGADGFTTSLRHLFPESKYMGIEIEMNQKYGIKNLREVESELFRPLLQGLNIILFYNKDY